MGQDLNPGAFRVWDDEFKRYVDPDKFKMLGNGEVEVYRASLGGGLAIWQKDPARYLVERWTGLYDSNRTPIFEGDRLRSEVYGLQGFWWDQRSATWRTDIKGPWYITLAKLLEHSCKVDHTIHDAAKVGEGVEG